MTARRNEALTNVCPIACSPEPHILLFRRPLGTDPQSGRVDPELQRQAREEYRSQYGMRN